MRKRKPGSVAFFAGFGILVLALIATATFGVFIGGPLVVAALALVVRGLTAEGPKATGKPCAQCRRTIVVEQDAELCEHCGLAVHAGCAAAHRAADHKLEPGQPFR